MINQYVDIARFGLGAQLMNQYVGVARFGVVPQYLGNLLGHMCSLMEVLLAKGENANIMLPPNVVSPLYYLMRVVCAMSPLLLSFTSEQVSFLVSESVNRSVSQSDSVTMSASCQNRSVGWLVKQASK